MEHLATYAMDARVLAVAVQRVDGWCAYVGSVAGVNHMEEYRGVMAHGCKLPARIARAIFSGYAFAEGEYAESGWVFREQD